MAVTAYAGHEDEERIRAAGADAYVSKPISLARFMEAVRALLPPDAPSGRDASRGSRATDAWSVARRRPRFREGPCVIEACGVGLLDLGFLELDMLAHDRIVFAEGHLLGLCSADSSW